MFNILGIYEQPCIYRSTHDYKYKLKCRY